MSWRNNLLSESVQCPECGHNNKVERLVFFNPANIQCMNCHAHLQSKGVTFTSVLIRMFISIIVMSVGLSSILVYCGVPESVANGIGLVCTFVLMYVLIKKSKKWDIVKEPDK